MTYGIFVQFFKYEIWMLSEFVFFVASWTLRIAQEFLVRFKYLKN
jgi:hypothetical protein